ncbi:hypothetical protein [Chlorogloeopsis sp. ULAP02]|uniref:hypothetical protein n=1 Tax=Chlorogloeopsis sp. ULAP02 TaxID=3107926 RepID=UPI003135C2D0
MRVKNSQANWELTAVEVEYLFMGCGNRKHRQFTEGNRDFRYAKISVLNRAPQIDEESGRYRHRDTVPI